MFIVLIKTKIGQLFSLTEKQWSVLITLVGALIFITPVCGFLFQCGCDWPWSGLDSNCNFYKPNAQYRCPWCVSMISGVMSIGISIAGGLLATISNVNFFTFLFKKYLSINEVVIRVVVGLGTFLLITILTASISAIWQNYPLGLGYFYKID